MLLFLSKDNLSAGVAQKVAWMSHRLLGIRWSQMPLERVNVIKQNISIKL